MNIVRKLIEAFRRHRRCELTRSLLADYMSAFNAPRVYLKDQHAVIIE